MNSNGHFVALYLGNLSISYQDKRVICPRKLHGHGLLINNVDGDVHAVLATANIAGLVQRAYNQLPQPIQDVGCL